MNNIFGKTTVNYSMHLQFKFKTAGKFRQIEKKFKKYIKKVKIVPIFKIVFKIM